MAINCAICNKKQDKWFHDDFPLNPDLHEHRICEKCYEKLKKIKDSGTPENEKEAIEYLESYLETISVQEVKNYVEEVIFRAKNPTLAKERDAKESAEKALLQQQMEEKAAEEKRIFKQNVQNIMLTTGTSF